MHLSFLLSHLILPITLPIFHHPPRYILPSSSSPSYDIPPPSPFTPILFQMHRRHHGLLCFRQLLAVYSHLSIYSLEHRAQLAGVTIHSGDVCRALATLEQCNASFVKCAIPLILAPTSHIDGLTTAANGSSNSNMDSQSSSSSTFPSSTSPDNTTSTNQDVTAWQAFGCVIIKEIFLTAESVLDLLAAQSLTDDVMNVLRYG